MNPFNTKAITVTAGLGGIVAICCLAHSGSAIAQVNGSVPSFLKLQNSTPGTQQTGHANVSGTVRAGQFAGGGSGLTGVPWSSITGAPTSFPPNGSAGGDLLGTYPNPVIGLGVVDNSNLANDAASLSKVSNGQMAVSASLVTVGTPVSVGAAKFVVNQATTNFGGMYVNTSANGLPFYGYSQGTTIAGYTFIDGNDSNKWKLHVGINDPIVATTTGNVGINTINPGYKLEVHDSVTSGYFVSGVGSSSTPIAAVPGLVSTTNQGDAIYGSTDKTNSYALVGYATGSLSRAVYGRVDSGTSFGIYGRSTNAAGYAGWFEGQVQVSGTLSKGGGSFKIDHPLDPANKYLYHSFVESPDMMNIYNGTVTTDNRGYATVTMPSWFKALNSDFRYSLTVIDSTDSAEFVMAKVVKEMSDNRFTLRTSAPHSKVSWMVTGIRQDAFANAHRIPVEQDKPESERGTYLYPKEMGVSPSLGLAEKHDKRAVQNQGP